jgi:hypothetical protein
MSQDRSPTRKYHEDDQNNHRSNNPEIASRYVASELHHARSEEAKDPALPQHING